MLVHRLFIKQLKLTFTFLCKQIAFNEISFIPIFTILFFSKCLHKKCSKYFVKLKIHTIFLPHDAMVRYPKTKRRINFISYHIRFDRVEKKKPCQFSSHAFAAHHHHSPNRNAFACFDVRACISYRFSKPVRS